MGRAFIAAFEPPQHLFTQPEDVVGVGKNLLARGGQFQVPSTSIEQRPTQATLQLFNLRGERGLGRVDLFGRVRERTSLCHVPEVKQMSEVQLANVHCSILKNGSIL